MTIKDLEGLIDIFNFVDIYCFSKKEYLAKGLSVNQLRPFADNEIYMISASEPFTVLLTVE